MRLERLACSFYAALNEHSRPCEEAPIAALDQWHAAPVYLYEDH